MNRSVSLQFNEYIRETAVMVAINKAVIKFSLIQFYILCFIQFKARFEQESKQRMSWVFSLINRQSYKTVRLLSVEHILVVQILGNRSYFLSLIGTYFC